MTLTSDDTIGVRRGLMDRHCHLLRIYAPHLTPDEIAAAAPLKGAVVLSWTEIAALASALGAACNRVNRSLPRTM